MSKRCERFSLSPRERAGVGSEHPNFTPAQSEMSNAFPLILTFSLGEKVQQLTISILRYYPSR